MTFVTLLAWLPVASTTYWTSEPSKHIHSEFYGFLLLWKVPPHLFRYRSHYILTMLILRSFVRSVGNIRMVLQISGADETRHSSTNTKLNYRLTMAENWLCIVFAQLHRAKWAYCVLHRYIPIESNGKCTSCAGIGLDLSFGTMLTIEFYVITAHCEQPWLHFVYQHCVPAKCSEEKLS